MDGGPSPDARPAVVVADAHVGREPGDARPLVELLDRLGPRSASSLYLLGDIFQYLIGDRKFMTPSIEEVLGALGRLRSRGVPVRYIEGNRDFFVRGSFLESSFDGIALEIEIPAPGGAILLVHGDSVNDRDRAYRFWRFASKNALAQAVMRATPERLARTVVARTEARLGRSNFKHKSRLPEERIREFAALKWDEGFRTVLLGHFHDPWSFDAPGGRRVAVVPAWFRTRHLGVVDLDGSYHAEPAETFLGRTALPA